MLLTIGFLIVPPNMAGSIAYNVVTVVVLGLLAAEFVRAHPNPWQRAALAAFLLGICGWLYYQTASTLYGLLGWAAAPPAVHEVNRIGEAFMVLASILVLPAYGGLSWHTKNVRQRRRFVFFAAGWVSAFLLLFFLDFLLGLYDRHVADAVRKGSEGIGWIFQMGMGYTFYLPFALYMAGLLCWAYTVVKLVAMGRLAGYGLGLMFMAGYALQLSHLTLMVVLGLLLLTLDRRRQAAGETESVGRMAMAPPVPVEPTATTVGSHHG
jgi:hypothetical protein